jgi:hypothetical protein
MQAKVSRGSESKINNNDKKKLNTLIIQHHPSPLNVPATIGFHFFAGALFARGFGF